MTGEVGSWAIRYLCLSAGQFRNGGAGGIRTLDRPLQAYNGLANRRLQPLGHSSVEGGYARARGEPQAADCRPRSSQPNRQPRFCRSSGVCVLFVQHLPETSIQRLSARRLYIAWAGGFSNSRIATEGGPPRSFSAVRRNSRARAGEARALRS